MFTPSRKAPLPPTYQTHTYPTQPTYNPFPNHPEGYQTLHHASSDSSIYSTYSTPSRAQPTAYRTHSSPTSSFASPLSPRPYAQTHTHTNNLGHYTTTTSRTPIHTYHSRYPSTSTTSSSISSTYVPKDLQLFNPSSRNTLLSDLEYISGKKFQFPALKRFSMGMGRGSKSEGNQVGLGFDVKGEKVGWETRGEGMGMGKGKLRKGKWEEEIPGVVVVKRGRGVREGNRI